MFCFLTCNIQLANLEAARLAIEREQTPASVTQTSQQANGDSFRRSRSRKLTPGPGDDATPPQAILQLTGHTSEVMI